MSPFTVRQYRCVNFRFCEFSCCFHSLSINSLVSHRADQKWKWNLTLKQHYSRVYFRGLSKRAVKKQNLWRGGVTNMSPRRYILKFVLTGIESSVKQTGNFCLKIELRVQQCRNKVMIKCLSPFLVSSVNLSGVCVRPTFRIIRTDVSFFLLKLAD